MNEVSYQRHEDGAAAGELDTFLAAYQEVYKEPPYCEGPSDVSEFMEHYQVHARRPGMRLVLARNEDQVVGFGYGYHLARDTRWWANVQDVELPAEFIQEDGKRTFVIIELAVRKPLRRRGIAAAIHARLLDGLDAERVTLTMRPEAEAAPAQSAYAAWGYRKIGVSHPWAEAPLYDCMLRDLR
ncbi:GNAT family N-acetyltransferase [Streptomyces sp. NPDC047072]|uniref:GNAT family N-acetyltransferase n=1 Tax=Streptomyces sp. NPDC047072 TaxID=3154809 RepID=UPI00340EC933